MTVHHNLLLKYPLLVQSNITKVSFSNTNYNAIQFHNVNIQTLSTPSTLLQGTLVPFFVRYRHTCITDTALVSLPSQSNVRVIQWETSRLSITKILVASKA